MVCLNLLDQHLLTRSVSNSAKLSDFFFFTLQPWSRNTHCHDDCLSCYCVFYFILCPSLSLSPDTRFPWAFIRNTPDSPASIHSPDAPETIGGINFRQSVRVWKVKPGQQCLKAAYYSNGELGGATPLDAKRKVIVCKRMRKWANFTLQTVTSPITSESQFLRFGLATHCEWACVWSFSHSNHWTVATLLPAASLTPAWHPRRRQMLEEKRMCVGGG